MLKAQAERTPKGQWVRVVGGFSPNQFEEKRLPTPQELTAIAPDTPIFVLHLYSGGVLNQKALEVLNINKDTKAPEGSVIERDSAGNPTGVLLAQPNPMILYKTIAALPQMTTDQQLNSSRQFYRKLLSLGVTSVIDAEAVATPFRMITLPARHWRNKVNYLFAYLTICFRRFLLKKCLTLCSGCMRLKLMKTTIHTLKMAM